MTGRFINCVLFEEVRWPDIANATDQREVGEHGRFSGVCASVVVQMMVGFRRFVCLVWFVRSASNEAVKPYGHGQSPNALRTRGR